MKNSKHVAAEQVLTFNLGPEVFAVGVGQVREVLDDATVTRVPQTPEFMKGVINLRGSAVPVIDLRRKFNLPEAEKTRDTCIVVLEVKIDGDQALVGAVVDGVSEVMELAADQIEPPPRLGNRLDADFLRGMGKKGEQFLILLDIDKVFSADELVLPEKLAAPSEAS